MANFPGARNILRVTRKIWSYSYRGTHEAVGPEIGGAKIQEDLPEKLDSNPFAKEPKQCILCKHNIEPDYKNVRLLSQFQSRYTGRIYGRHITGLCSFKQKRLEEEILKAQSAGLMGYYTKEVTFAKDPKLFDPDHPFRPHRF